MLKVTVSGSVPVAGLGVILKTGRKAVDTGCVVVVVVVVVVEFTGGGWVVVVVPPPAAVVGVVLLSFPPLAATATPPPTTAAAPATIAMVVPVARPAAAKPAGSDGKTVTEAFVTNGATGRSFLHSRSFATTSAGLSGVRLSVNC